MCLCAFVCVHKGRCFFRPHLTPILSSNQPQNMVRISWSSCFMLFMQCPVAFFWVPFHRYMVTSQCWTGLKPSRRWRVLWPHEVIEHACTPYLGLPRVSQQRRQWQPTPVLLLGKFHGWRSLVGYSPWGREYSDMTKWLRFHFSLSCIGEGNGNPL